jgi:lipopolysaccharide transport system permease protein
MMEISAKLWLFIMISIIELFEYGWCSRRVWWFTATARTRARFARTAFGGFWLGLSNLLSIAVLSLVYGTVFKVPDFSRYAVFIGTGLVVWNALSAAISSAPSLFEVNATLLRNTNLHPIFYTLEEWAFQVQAFAQSFIMVLLGLSFFKHDLFLNLFLFSWLPMANILLFLYWFPLLVCILGARFRDFYQLVPIALQLSFLLSPILYDKKNLAQFGWIADFNPIYLVLSPLRHALQDGEVNVSQSMVVLAFNFFGLFLALWLLASNRKQLPFFV